MKYDIDQIKAIKSMDNTLVIAGAGSGKTTTIIGKIDYIIKNNLYEEEEILIISFTNETVKELKSKIKYQIDVKTFHKLAKDIISKINKDLSIANDYELKYIINEYFNSYGKYNKKTNLIIKRIMQSANQKQIQNLIFSFINIYKCNYEDIYYLYNLYKKSIFINKYYFKIILDIYLIYSSELESSGKMDFNELIINATKYIKENKVKLNYKYIIIDEFQDISLIRFKLINSILNQNKAHIFAVGDDFQSIYKFSGCDISLFINIKTLLPDINIIKLNHNYRNNQSLINIANRFIMKNKKQIIKNTICHKDDLKPIKIVFYVDKKTVVNNILKNIKGNILILGRNNKDKEIFNIIENKYIKFLTIHSSKGMEEDNVILINLENSTLGLPLKTKKESILNKIFKCDYIIHEEERRLFYVALTRSRNNVYLITPYDNYSVFIKEIIKDNYKNLDFIHIK
ncbi:MAG: UvrD-helicase domain-containing protein [Bacilli bacterium]|nr:UvrD-helicase domain-containing protein [Bacilli bacterium]MDD3895560.1 UvrD-helicase domain-containing protein [Bacilli bacterium]MDD4407543.1 UvrD-helicase domain-containing protein [Bacilli bacterium]